MSQAEIAEALAQKLLERIVAKEAELMLLSRQATGNSLADTRADLRNSTEFLTNFRQQQLPLLRKPKGDILIMLSYNEPLLLSVIPIFCALMSGNILRVRPSSKNRELLQLIWGDLIVRHHLAMEIIRTDIEDIETEVSTVRAVYFFGSHQNARHVYQLCAKHFVEFIPEIETADVKILSWSAGGRESFDFEDDISTTLTNAFHHNGRMCQRISGLYIDRSSYMPYLNKLDARLSGQQFKVVRTQPDGSTPLLHDIHNSRPSRVYQKGDQFVVIDPGTASVYVRNGYFNECLWIKPYADEATLVEALNARAYFMGLNISSDDQDFTERLINQTNFSRYTLGSNHCDISNDTGWGGNWPSGSGGYKNWYETFSNAYIVIR